MDQTRTMFGGSAGRNIPGVFCCFSPALHRILQARFLALDAVYQCIEIAERCTQFQGDLTITIHDDSFNHLAQQFFLFATLQAIIQRSDICDKLQRQIQVIDMNLLLVLHRL
ncbi:MAG: hypothetical protein KA401_03010 [Anaerolineae bacterium]|nr:hypothetical protein [Anaerolineae bacterium]